MRSVLKRICFVLVCSLFLSGPCLAASQKPGEYVMKAIEDLRVFVLANKDSMPEEQLDAKLREMIEPLFDFREMAQRSLGASWSKGNPAQQEEYVTLFTQLLSRTYLKRIRQNVQTSKVTLAGEAARSGKAVVKTSIDDSEDIISLEYRLNETNDRWRIYDVVIENVGLVNNYRNEFGGLVRKGGFEGLLQELRNKVAHRTE